MKTGMAVEMRVFNYSVLLLLTSFMVSSEGCSNNADEQVSAVIVPAVSKSLPPHPVAESRAAVDDLKPSPSEAKEKAVKAAFEYPFPDREDLFLPPAKKPPSSDVRVKSNEDVVLMGFANVGEARVVLRIDGVVTSLRVGESRGDIGVQAIEPPKVDLQRGEHQWTENLADTP